MIVQSPISNYARVRRLANRYCWGIKTQATRLRQAEAEMLSESENERLGYSHYTLKNDWEVMLVFLTRLRRRLLMLQKIGLPLMLAPSFLIRFDQALPDLKDMRDYEEHFDDYSLDKGRNNNAAWGHLESYQYDSKAFSNGLGNFSVEASLSAALIAWEAVASLESSARDIGYRSWEDRYETNKLPGENA